MELRIVPGTSQYLDDCKEAYKNSELGEAYFSSEADLTFRLMEGIGKREIFVALDEGNRCMGYIWMALRGAFYDFPYCPGLAVRKEYRGRGVGSALLRHYEKAGFEYSDRIFILVSDFNLKARKLYERLGYKQVGLIPDLFEEGISELILVKYRPEDCIC